LLPGQIAMMCKKIQEDSQKGWSSTQRLRSFCAIILHWRGKKDFFDAAKITEVNVLKLMNEAIAI